MKEVCICGHYRITWVPSVCNALRSNQAMSNTLLPGTFFFLKKKAFLSGFLGAADTGEERAWRLPHETRQAFCLGRAPSLLCGPPGSRDAEAFVVPATGMGPRPHPHFFAPVPSLALSIQILPIPPSSRCHRAVLCNGSPARPEMGKMRAQKAKPAPEANGSRRRDRRGSSSSVTFASGHHLANDGGLDEGWPWSGSSCH